MKQIAWVVAGVVVATIGVGACAKRPARAAPAPGSRTLVSPLFTLIPAPSRVAEGKGGPFPVTSKTPIVVSPGNARLLEIGRFLSDLIGPAAGPDRLRVEALTGSAPAGSIALLVNDANTALGDEGYELAVTPEAVTIVGRTAAGVFYGVQTLRQLLPPWLEYEAVRPDADWPITVPAATITDQPRFAWRGAMLDVSRHFLNVDDVKRYIDLLTLYKMNRLHLHLADDQGWRIEIKSWPRLTEYGGRTEVGGGPGGFFTQDGYTNIVKYGQERFLTIVPEIDMPGHTNAALASYAELNCDGVAPPLYSGIEVGFSVFCVDKDVTYRFIDDVVREISGLTPGPYFHVGGDEVKKLTAPKYAQFIERVQGIVRSHGKQMIGWDEISPVNLLPTSIVQHWRPDSTPAAAVAKGAKVILSPANKVYLDMKYHRGTPIGLNWAAYIGVEAGYSWDPATLLKDVPETAILGVEAPLWSETIATMADAEYLAFPRVAGVAEIGWSPAERREWSAYRERLAAHAARWSALGVNFYRSPDVPWRH
ncbi:MAG: beta-N-acetylhexosaminidase [Acidobacteria bacterium]|nr:beta-N-acetylhexosaminidase [Acidobacteriota bacterium]MCA1651070.1 beta-N-acetylhexosaminidase [Acidobacteriota bacterium]